MKLRLHYLHPGQTKPVATEVDPGMPYFETWLYSMMKTQPDSIWFYTTDTTDIFDDYDYGNYDFSRVTVLERYRGHTITTRLSGGIGCRVYLPHGGGLLNFAPTIFHARELIDNRLQEEQT